MDIDRRMFAAGLTACTLAGAPANAATGDPVALWRHPAYRPWSRMKTPPATPMEQPVTTLAGRSLKLSDWLEDRPVALIIWATWCPPCMAEKKAQAALQDRLIAAGSRARIKSLQAYDNVSLAEGQKRVARLGAPHLDIARASPGMEQALKTVFGKSPVDPARTSLPAQLLLAPDGHELARSLGMLPSDGRMVSYWSQTSTYDLMSSLEMLAQA